MDYAIPSAMIGTGIVVGSLIGVGKIDVSALLLVAPMLVFGVWIFAVSYIKRRNNGNIRESYRENGKPQKGTRQT
jgi:ATP/ADP translocase